MPGKHFPRGIYLFHPEALAENREYLRIFPRNSCQHLPLLPGKGIVPAALFQKRQHHFIRKVIHGPDHGCFIFQQQPA
ncbi:hypothetical protein EG028_22460 [Chitinophaga barathri]|uniref:Uncharacterized protein n=1 Tax=Chitinophaga barathri TaxID=1647451 RepID=A0A3N4M6Z2_9BACT|nr:hypothetical protein EG028_22460 [Chitinophaga barathri]